MDRIDTTEFASVPADAGAAADVTPPQRQAAQEALDVVFIEDLVGTTLIGIDTSEAHRPQPLRINLAIGVPSLRACMTDRIEDTVNYAAVREAIHALLAAHGVKLLEALAERVAHLLIRDFGAHWVRVGIAKPAKFDDVKAVGVVIERRRGASRPTELTWASLGAGMIPN